IAVEDTLDLERYARQVVLPEVGLAGQRRLLSAEVVVEGHGLTARVAARYLAAAGVRVLRRSGTQGVVAVLGAGTRMAPIARDGSLVVGEVGAGSASVPSCSGATAVALGALLADAVERRIVQPDVERGASLDLGGVVGQKRFSCS
ncbi:MAG: hypothetical protein KDB73_10235, partial [Planctomycetes bacterium]|nr:hypothetical protein [Planctomycetota bacterium]